MSARHLRTTRPIRSEGYKRAGAFIVTTLAFNTVPHQYTTPLTIDIGEGFHNTDGANRRHGFDTESNAASALQSENTRSFPRDLRRTATLEENFLTKAVMWVCHDLVCLDNRSGSKERPVTPCDGDLAEQSTLNQHVATPKPELHMERSVEGLDRGAIFNDFHKAALHPLPISHPEPYPQTSLRLGIPCFLHPANRVDNPRSQIVMNIVALHQANQPSEALAVMRAEFSEGEFEEHLMSHIRQKMLQLGTQKKSEDLALSDPLLCAYSAGLQEWSASVFDATVRRLLFTITAVYSLSSVDPITNQLYFHPEVNIRFSRLKDEISCARDWLEIYIQAEPKLTQAVNKIKKNFTKEDLRDWRAYKKTHALTSSTVKTRRLEQPFRSMTSLSKNTHFISWFLRRTTPAFFLRKRRRIVKAIRAIEGEFSMLADVLEHLCVLDLADFERQRKMLERERFQRYVKVPTE